MDVEGHILADSRSQFTDALRRRDASAASKVYTDDARLLPPAAGAVVGREEIRAFWEAGLDSGMAEIQYRPSSFRGDGAMACEIGRYSLRFDAADGEQLTERGHYVHVHERQADGTWMRTVDMFTPGGDE